jgi:DNA polymerase III subunit beta
MKLICSQSELSTALHVVSRAVSSRPTHPVLANVLLTADATTGRVTLTGFDLNLGIRTSVLATVETAGSITVPARLLVDIVSRMAADSPITIAVGDGDQVELTSQSGTYQVSSLPAADYPDLPLEGKGDPIELDAQALLHGLKATVFASSNDESKQLLTGVHLCLSDEGLGCAATDGHRLAVLNSPHQGQLGGAGFAVTIPAKSLREVERMIAGRQGADALSMHCDRGQVVFRWGDELLTTRTLDGTYPAYEKLIPEKFSEAISVDRKGLLAALDRVAVVADQHNNVVKVTADADRMEIVIRADAQDVGRAAEALSGDVRGKGIEIAFNVRYVLDGLKAMSGESVTLHCNAPTTPAVLRSEEDAGFTYLVMPVQVRS